jgi:hypothetical protein
MTGALLLVVALVLGVVFLVLGGLHAGFYAVVAVCGVWYLCSWGSQTLADRKARGLDRLGRRY